MPSYIRHDPIIIVTAMAIQASETYGDNLSPTLAHLKNRPKNLRYQHQPAVPTTQSLFSFVTCTLIETGKSDSKGLDSE